VFAPIPARTHDAEVLEPTRRGSAVAASCPLVVALLTLAACASNRPGAARVTPGGPVAEGTGTAREPSTQRDGRHDFDFEIGTWRSSISRRLHPLTGSDTWVRYEGTTVVRTVWDGRANLVELVADGPAGHFEGLSLRLYNPQSHQWSLHFASSRDGAMSPPTTGGFRNGRGEFYGLETLDDRVIYVRFVVSDIAPSTCRFEQAFSADGGKTWEVNWIAIDTRVEAARPQASVL